MIVVDCNILAYLLIESERTPTARALLERDPEWHSETFALVELTNVLTTSIRAGRLDFQRATHVLTDAQAVMLRGLHTVPHTEVLALATRLRISAYDARYLAVATGLNATLVTEDQRLRRAAPDLTRSLADATSME